MFPIVDELLPTIEAYDINFARISAGLARLSQWKRGSPMRTSKQHVEEGIYHRHPASMSDILQTLTEERFSLSFDKIARRWLKSALLFDFHLYIIFDDAHGKTLYVPLRGRFEDRAGFYFESGTVPWADHLILRQHSM